MTTIATVCAEIDALRSQLAKMHESRDTWQRLVYDERARTDHARAEARAAAEALKLSWEVRDELRADCEQLTAQVEAMRAENHELQVRVWELEGDR